MLPNFFLPGTQKSGTTTLFELIRQHPQCFIPDIKTPEFFCRMNYMDEMSEYKGFYNNVSEKQIAVGDFSQGYYYNDDVPRRMSEVLSKDIKLMFIYREPVGRAISAYWQVYKIPKDRRYKFLEERKIEDVFDVNVSSLDELISLEEENLRNAIDNDLVSATFNSKYEDPKFPLYYLRNSRYSQYLKNFLKYFSKDQMLFICLEEFNKSPKQGVKEIFTFLGVDIDFKPANINKVFHPTVLPKKNNFSRLTHLAMPYMNRAFGKPKFLNDFYIKNFYFKKPKDPAILVSKLRAFYKEDVEELCSLTGKPFDKIWKYS